MPSVVHFPWAALASFVLVALRLSILFVLALLGCSLLVFVAATLFLCTGVTHVQTAEDQA